MLEDVRWVNAVLLVLVFACRHSHREPPCNPNGQTAARFCGYSVRNTNTVLRCAWWLGLLGYRHSRRPPARRDSHSFSGEDMHVCSKGNALLSPAIQIPPLWSLH